MTGELMLLSRKKFVFQLRQMGFEKTADLPMGSEYRRSEVVERQETRVVISQGVIGWEAKVYTKHVNHDRWTRIFRFILDND